MKEESFHGNDDNDNDDVDDNDNDDDVVDGKDLPAFPDYMPKCPSLKFAWTI